MTSKTTRKKVAIAHHPKTVVTIPSWKDEDDEDYYLKFNTVAGWQTIVLLQFQVQMKIAIVGCIFLAYICTVIDAGLIYSMTEDIPFEDTETRQSIRTLIYIGDLLYFVDCISMILFKRANWAVLNSQYSRRSMIIICIEIFSLIPIDAVYRVMVPPYTRGVATIRLRYTLRTVRLTSFFREAQNYVGNYSHVIHICIYLGMIVLASVTTGMISYIHKCRTFLKEGICGYEDTVHFGDSMYMAFNTWTFVGNTYVTADKVMNSLLVTTIAFLITAFFIGLSVCGILRRVQNKFIHMNKHTWYIRRIAMVRAEYAKDWTSYHKKYEGLVNQYCSIVWQRTQGFNAANYTRKFIPIVMYKQLYLDTTWVPLKHSHLFKEQDVCFLRLISEIATHTFFCPGEIIFKRDHYKSQMIYIISGVAEILSEEDGETPIMSLTSGSCIGETSLVIGYPSPSTVVSKDVCDVVILGRVQFMKIAPLYPKNIKHIIHKVKRRYRKAKAYKLIADYQISTKDFDDRIGVLTMKWLKQILRQLMSSTRRLGDCLDLNFVRKLERYFFCTTYLDLLAQAEGGDLENDAIFQKTNFPVVFKPDSVVMKIWKYAVLFCTAYLVATFPLYFVYYELNPSYHVSFIIVSLIWVMDLYVRSSTAIKIKFFYCNTLTDIVVHQLSNFTYMLDCFAVVPFELFTYMLQGSISDFEMMLSCSNRLLKFYKFEEFFSSIKSSTQQYIYLTFVKFICYLLCLLYYLAMICYILSQLPENTRGYADYISKFGVTSIHDQIYMCVFGMVQFYCDLDVGGFPFEEGLKSKSVLAFFQVIIVIFNACFIGYLAATMTMNMLDEHKMVQFTRDVNITIEAFKIDDEMKKKIWNNINLQHEASGIYFLIGDAIFKELPQDLYVMSRSIQLGEVLKGQPFFYDLSDSIISKVASMAVCHLIPAGDCLKRIGDLCHTIYILHNGMCAVTDYRHSRKIIDAGECLCLLEACLEIPSLLTITTETPCQIVSVSFKSFKAILLNNTSDYRQLEHVVDTYEYYDEVDKQSHPMLYMKKPKKKAKEHDYKFFGYFLKKRTKKYYVFSTGFPRWAMGFQYVLIRMVISCKSPFVYYWEASRSVLAFATAFMVPIVEFAPESNVCYYILLSLDITAYIDIYMRHHISFYNEKGLEIMHPMKTAIYYWKHAFAMDLLASLPAELILQPLFHRFRFFVLRANRFIQMYRYHKFLNLVFLKNVTQSMLSLVMYIPYIIIVDNVIASIILRFFCDFTQEKMVCRPETCFARQLISAPETTLHQMYGFSVYFTTMLLTVTNHYILSIGTVPEITFVVVIAFSAIIIYNLILGKMIEGNLAINRDLSAYQERMKQLVRFISSKKIDKNLKNELVYHYEYAWERTKGKNVHTVFNNLKQGFKIDILYNIYGVTFVKSNIFPAPNEAFFRSVLRCCRHELCLNTGFVYSVNDISGTIYLLLKGQVEVVGADDNKLETLTTGSVFGNLDNCPLGRRTLSIVACGHVDVLAFSSIEFHRHLAKFPHIQNNFKKLTSFDVDYLAQPAEINRGSSKLPRRASTFSTFVLTQSRRLRNKFKVFSNNIVIRIWENYFISVLSFVNFTIAMYHLATLEDSIWFYCVIYTIDSIFIFNIYLKFHTCYQDEYGRYIYSHKAVAKRYMTQKLGFGLDLFAVLPFEVFAYCFNEHWLLMNAILRLNRAARVAIIICVLKSLTQRLNINVVVIRMLYLIVWTALAVISLGTAIALFDTTHYDTSAERLDYYRKCIKHMVNSAINRGNAIHVSNTMPLYWTLGISCLMIACKGIHIFIIRECAAILLVVNFTRHIYEQFIIYQRSYMSKEDVSEPLDELLTNYTKSFFVFHRGVQFPVLLTSAPYYLREAVLNSMFGYHLENHPVLKQIHKDLARQMTARMRTLVFFGNDTVAYVGDIDQCMYFIESGEINALSEDTIYSKDVDHVLKKEAMFGFAQGVEFNLGHNYTYEVVSYTVLVVLERKHWIDLLDFYPASKFLIYNALNIPFR